MITFLAQNNQGSQQYTQLIFIVLLFGAMYFLMIRPQQKRRREYLQLLSKLTVGDEIETVAGMFGTIRRLDDEHAWVEISEGTTVKMSRGAIRRRITVDEPSESEA